MLYVVLLAISINFTLEHSLFSYARDLRGCLEGSGAEGRGNMLGTASAFSFCFILKPIILAVAEVTSKQSGVKCSLQMAELVVGPFHLALVFFTCVVHIFLNFMSLGN